MALYQGLLEDEDDELMDVGHGKKLGYIGVRANDSNNTEKVQLFVSGGSAVNQTDGGDSSSNQL